MVETTEAAKLLKKLGSTHYVFEFYDSIRVTFTSVMPVCLKDFVVKLNEVSERFPKINYVVEIHVEGLPSRRQVEEAVTLKNHRNIDFVLIAEKRLLCSNIQDLRPVFEEIWSKGNWSKEKKIRVKGMHSFLLLKQSKWLPLEIHKRIFSYLLL